MTQKDTILAEMRSQRNQLDKLLSSLEQKEALSSSDFQLCEATTQQMANRMKDISGFSLESYVNEMLWS